MARKRGVFYWCRLGLLLLLLSCVAWLHHLSRRDDPRFYWFLQTPVGTQLARWFDWHRFSGAAGAGTAGGPLTDAEQAARDRLLARWPAGEPPPELSRRDLRFHLDYPTFAFHRVPPFTIVTDEKNETVETTVALLRELRAEFMDTFGELVARPQRGDHIQILFFSQEQAFRAAQRTYAPELQGGIGFYSAWLDRLVVFNLLNATPFRLAAGEVLRRADDLLGRAGDASERDAVERWRHEATVRLGQRAGYQNLVTLRHEGAHQLFYTCGVHSTFRAENEWLIEGLATYCETPTIGEVDPYRVRTLHYEKRRRRLIHLAELLNVRSSGGFTGLGSREVVDLAYSQSWALVHLLMQEPYRARFFHYLRHLRDPANLWEVSVRPEAERLPERLGMTFAQLEAAYLRHLEALAGGVAEPR